MLLFNSSPGVDVEAVSSFVLSCWIACPKPSVLQNSPCCLCSPQISSARLPRLPRGVGTQCLPQQCKVSGISPAAHRWHWDPDPVIQLLETMLPTLSLGSQETDGAILPGRIAVSERRVYNKNHVRCHSHSITHAPAYYLSISPQKTVSPGRG